MKITTIFILFCILQSCQKDDVKKEHVTPSKTNLYFPANNSYQWETTNSTTLNWNSSDTTQLYDFLSQNGTRAFILLKDGKIVFEKYWGKNFLDTAPFDAESTWYWASAGKTLTAFLMGIAQEKGLLNINNETSDYLGNGWTSLNPEKEDLILIKHQLTMTTGLDYQGSNPDCTLPSCLQYKSDAGTHWFYHNAPYTLLTKVIENASEKSYNNFTKEEVGAKIRMQGQWREIADKHVFWSTARDAARFGLLLLAKGDWADTQILSDKNYLDEMTNSSQSLNPSYGYLCWLNGKSSIMLPGLSISFKQPLSINAPADLYAAMGKNGQYIDVVPSENIVVIRMGEAPDSSAVPTVFHDELWKKTNIIIE